MPFALFTADTRAKLRQHDGGWFWKFVLRACSMFLALVTIIILAVTLSRDSVGVAYFLFIPLLASTLYTLIIIPITLKRARPIHPGANVAVDLILWLLFGLLGLYAIGASQLLNTLREYDESTDYVRPCGDSPSDPACDSFYDFYGGVARLLGASGGLSIVLAIIHFVLFVTACVDTHRYNSNKRNINIAAHHYATAHGSAQYTVPPPYGGHGAPPPAYPMQPMQPPSGDSMQPPGPTHASHYAPK
ncbi:MAG: hypothetical protein M1831_005591 [Alyxoria varia]|nr:MAG: hypothetical protein M1831_005591 [Alyxoria varia]